MTAPDVAFLGLCERAQAVREGDPITKKLNIKGLKNTILSYVFPMNISGFHVLIGVYDPIDFSPCTIRLLDADGEEIFNTELSLLTQGPSNLIDEASPHVQEQGVDIAQPRDHKGWVPVLYSLDDIHPIIPEPGLYRVVIERDDETLDVGHLSFAPVEAPPLTEDRIQAIKSQPGHKEVRVKFQCKQCGDAMKAYRALNQDEEVEEKGFVWNENLPEEWVCSCETNKISTEYIRENLHGYLPLPFHEEKSEIDFTRDFEITAAEATLQDFEKVLSEYEEDEREVHQFLRENSLLLQPFNPKRIFHEAPILSEYRADIAILNHRDELLLIELKKPGTKLSKERGGQSAELQAPIDQVQDWLYEIERDRHAVIRGIGIDPSTVVNVKGVVIAGRDYHDVDRELAKIKRFSRSTEIEFMTYDDLTRGVHTLLRQLGEY